MPANSPPLSPVPAALGAILARARSRQEVIATGLACLVPAGVCVLFRLWFGLGLVAVAAAYLASFLWADHHAAWQVPPRLRSLGADVARALTRGPLGLANFAVLQVLLLSGAIELGLAASGSDRIRGSLSVGVAVLGLVVLGVLSRRNLAARFALAIRLRDGV